MEIWSLMVQRNLMIPKSLMDFNDPKEFEDPQVFDDPKGISIGSMDLDNPNSTVIPPSSMVLFGLFTQCGQAKYYVLKWTYLIFIICIDYVLNLTYSIFIICIKSANRKWCC